MSLIVVVGMKFVVWTPTLKCYTIENSVVDTFYVLNLKIEMIGIF